MYYTLYGVIYSSGNKAFCVKWIHVLLADFNIPMTGAIQECLRMGLYCEEHTWTVLSSRQKILLP